MSASLLRSIALLILCLVAAGSAVALRPDEKIAGAATSAAALEAYLPDRFGGWQTVANRQMVLPDPQARRLVDEIYNATAVRTYENETGERIMLVLAYGMVQSDQLQLHRPEVCYRAQGFQVNSVGLAQISLGVHGSLPVHVLVTEKPLRQEPVTYWMRVGDRTVSGILDRQWAKLVTGFRGRVPDGVLVRVSSISADSKEAFATQARFIRDLIEAESAAGRQFLLGRAAARETAVRE